ncbi:MAG: S8 family serine peptidase [Proteobacteria bacterium]|nr:S8 family serine peptidase [Pseudomonadota bacterium]
MYKTLQIISGFIVLLLAAGTATADEKKRIEKEADLPRFTYAVQGKLDTVVRDDKAFAELTGLIRRDTESLLAHYDIADKSAERGRLAMLMMLDFLNDRHEAALQTAERIRALEEKPADKLLSGLRLRAMVAAARNHGPVNSPAYLAEVGKRIRTELDTLPYDAIANDVKQYKASAELMGEGRMFGYLHEVLQPTVDKAGSLSSDLAPAIINIRYSLKTALPLKQTLVATYAGYLDAHKIEKADIWAVREVALPKDGLYQPVNVAVWDGGVDSSLFKSQLVKDAKGNPAYIAYDLQSRPTKGELFPIPAALRDKLPEMKAQTKGFSDLRSNIDSPEASAVKALISGLSADAYKQTIEQIGLAGNYEHGTHVAGIALAGNPWARLVNGRLSYGYTVRPDPCPSLGLAKRGAAAHQAYVEFFKRHKVRVVNMSWGGTVKAVEGELELCGIGKTTEARKALAREYFEIEKRALSKAFQSAPEILFITAAGNSNQDSSFAEAIPSSIALPNLLTVGAVDKAGDEASFTSYGPTVKVHANGYQVESYLPGGDRVAMSGTWRTRARTDAGV